MATFTIDGIDDLMNDLNTLAKITDEAASDMLNAEADVIVPAQRKEIEQQWSGPHSMKISAKSVKKGRVKKTQDGHEIYVYPKGTRKRGKKRVSNGRIALVNEYGSSRRGTGKEILPRPAIQTATGKAEGTARDAAEKVFNAHMDKHKL